MIFINEESAINIILAPDCLRSARLTILKMNLNSCRRYGELRIEYS
jgi:hypothetical protein